MNDPLAELAVAISGVDEMLMTHDYDDLNLSLGLLASLRGERTRLARLEAIVEAHCARRMPRGIVELPGLVAERKGGAVRKAWDHERMWGRMRHHAVTSLAFDSNGTMDEDRAAIAEAAVAFVQQAASPSWRTTALRSLGIPYDDACETERGRFTVQLRVSDPSMPDDATHAPPS